MKLSALDKMYRPWRDGKGTSKPKLPYTKKPSGGIQNRSTPEMGKKRKRRRKRKSRK